MNRFLIILMFFFASSCETFQSVSIESLNVEEENKMKIFVEGGVTSQYAFHSLVLSKPSNGVEEQFYITDAVVNVIVNEDTFLYHSFTDKEIPYYKSDQKFNVSPGDLCYLSIEYGGIIYTAYDQTDAVTDFGISDIQRPVISEGFVGTGAEYYDINKHDFGYDVPNIWLWIDRDSIGDQNLLEFEDIATFSHRGAAVQGVFSDITHFTSIRVSGDEDIIRVAKLSVSEDYYNYLRASFSETDWKGGFFSTIPGNLPTNVSNGGGGFFFVSDITISSFTGAEIDSISSL